VQLVVRGAALPVSDPFHHFQQLFLSELASQVEVVPPHSPQLPPVEAGLARPRVHRTRRVSDPQVHGENRGVGIFQLNLTLHDEVQEVLTVAPEQLGLADLEIIVDFAVGLDGHPDATPAEFDRDADPVTGDFGIATLDPDEVFSDGERIFSLWVDTAVESLGLLFVRRVEFDAGIAPQEPLQPIVFVVNDLALILVSPTTFALTTFCTCTSSTNPQLVAMPSSDFGGGVTESNL